MADRLLLPESAPTVADACMVPWIFSWAHVISFATGQARRLVVKPAFARTAHDSQNVPILFTFWQPRDCLHSFLGLQHICRRRHYSLTTFCPLIYMPLKAIRVTARDEIT